MAQVLAVPLPRSPRSMVEPEPEPAPTVEAWARAYVLTTELATKLRPPPPPAAWEDAVPGLDGSERRGSLERCEGRLPLAPGRPPELVSARHAPKSPGANALRSPARRAQVVHTFLHHELQAAELMCWALLAFPGAPLAFRKGLLGVALDEVRHLGLYAAHLGALGHAVGAFPVRDWFWERVPGAPTAAHFVAVMGMGFEGGNLDHSARYAERFRAAGDPEGAALQELVGREEEGHVRFAVRWFERWTGGADFPTWVGYLPPPLSPMVMRGAPLNREARARSGFGEGFLDDLERWTPGPLAPGG